MIIAQRGQLTATDPGEGPRVEDEHRGCPEQIRPAHRLAMLIPSAQVWGRLSDLRHRRVPRGRTILVADQSPDTGVLVVRDKPAATAASARSAASTYPVRPTLGVISQM